MVKLKGYQRYKFIQDKMMAEPHERLSVREIASLDEIQLSSGNAVSVWMSRNNDKYWEQWRIERKENDKINSGKLSNNNENDKTKTKVIKKEGLGLIFDNDNNENDNSQDIIKNSNLIIPSFNQFVDWIDKHPDHVHHEYFKREISRNKKSVDLVIDNQSILMKALDVIRDMN